MLTACDVSVPPEVISELNDHSQYQDIHSAAATNVLAAQDYYTVEAPYVRSDTTEARPTFGLDDGEIDGIVLANALGVNGFLTDKFGGTNFALIHAVLQGLRIVPTSRLICDYARNGHMTQSEARSLITNISPHRSWDNSPYVSQVLTFRLISSGYLTYPLLVVSNTSTSWKLKTPETMLGVLIKRSMTTRNNSFPDANSSMAPTNESGTFDLNGELTVNRLGFGAMRLCGEDIIGPPEDEQEAKDVVQQAVELGVDFIDTADSYGPGVSERLLREAVDTSDVTIATKAGLLRNSDGEWLNHADPDYIRNQVLVSRDRLGVESIDLYQLHSPDPDTPFEDSVTAFAELKDEGFIDHIGLSNVSVDQLEAARDHVEIASVQNEYNMLNRDHEDVLQACEEYGIGFIPYFPIAAGSISGVDVIQEVADAHDATVYQIALAWLLEHSDVTLPIPGTASLEHLEENVAASSISLSNEEYSKLVEVVSTSR